MTPIFVGAVAAVATAALLSAAEALRRRTALRGAAALLLVVALVGVAQAPAFATSGPEVNVNGRHTYVNPPGGCLFVSGTPGLGNMTAVGYGYPRVDSYGSIDWNSQNNGTGTPCGNHYWNAAAHSFYVVQVLESWNSANQAWDMCNFGPQVWNPGPVSHGVRTGYSWPQTPCPYGQTNRYRQGISIADQFGAGYGTWAWSGQNDQGYTTVFCYAC